MDVASSPIPELNRLEELQHELEGEFLAEGFEIIEYADASFLRPWSEDPDFLDRLIPFAQANHSGSVYALWRLDDRADLASLPVVVFGDEGGQHVVARTLRELFQLLGHDREIMVDRDEAFFPPFDDDDEPSGGHERYVAWLDERGLSPTHDPDSVVSAAQAELGERFAKWVGRFVTDD